MPIPIAERVPNTIKRQSKPVANLNKLKNEAFVIVSVFDKTPLVVSIFIGCMLSENHSYIGDKLLTLIH